MSEVMAGSGSYIHYGRGSTYKGGDRAVDKHQAFNPMLKSPDFPEGMRYLIEKITTFNKLNHNIEFDKELGEETVRFRCYFRDPIFLATLWTYKGVTGSWSATGDQLTFNFSTFADRDLNIWVAYHLHDQSGNSNHMDIFLDGGQVVSYKWILEQGQPIIEEFEIKFAEISVATETMSVAYAPDIDDGFDDESFNQTGIAEVTTITTVAAAALTTGEYFKIWLANGTGGFTAYYMWVNLDAGGGNPAPSGFTAIELTVTTGDSADTIATAIGAALDGAADNFGTPAVSTNVVTVTQVQLGDIKDAVDVDTTFTIATTTQGVTAIDGGWSNWDGAYTTKQAAMVVNATVTFNGAAISDLGIKTIEIEIFAATETYRTQESLTVANSYLGKREPAKGTADGVVKKGNSLFAQPSTVIASKTQGTFKIQYGTTKYLQFTNARCEEGGIGGVEAGKGAEGNLTFIAGADSVATFSWNADEATDPSAHIEHTDL